MFLNRNPFSCSYQLNRHSNKMFFIQALWIWLTIEYTCLFKLAKNPPLPKKIIDQNIDDLLLNFLDAYIEWNIINTLSRSKYLYKIVFNCTTSLYLYIFHVTILYLENYLIKIHWNIFLHNILTCIKRFCIMMICNFKYFNSNSHNFNLLLG